MTTGHTNPLDAAYQEMTNYHGAVVLAMTRLRRELDQEIGEIRAGGHIRMTTIRRRMAAVEDARDLYDASREAVTRLEAEHVRSTM